MAGYFGPIVTWLLEAGVEDVPSQLFEPAPSPPQSVIGPCGASSVVAVHTDNNYC